MDGIFISYRREDSAPYAGRICDHLRRTFPTMGVFMDIDAIAVGADFISAIDANLSESGIVLALIGPRWENATDGNGRRRIENPDDHVAREISAALQRGVTVIPLLVGGAKMPLPAALPAQLQDLTRRNAMDIADNRFGEDFERLCATIVRELDVPRDDWRSGARVEYGRFFSNAALARARSRFRRVVWTSQALTMLFLLLLVVGAWIDRPRNTTESMQPLSFLPCEDLKTADEKANCHNTNLYLNTVSRLSNDPSVMEPLAIVFAVMFGVPILVFWVFVLRKLLQGRGWARLAFVLVAVFLALVGTGLFEARVHGAQYIALVSLYLATATTYAWAVWMMYTEPGRRWFART